MAQANDSFTRNPDGSGVALATHLIGGKEHPVEIPADVDGHILGSLPAYVLYQAPRATTTTVTDYFDIFNGAGSGKLVRIRGLWSIVDVAVAVALTRSIVFDVFRTNSVGTGGTAIPYKSASKPAAGAGTIWPLDTGNANLPAQITSRALPTGGAAAAEFLFDVPILAEETQPAGMLGQGINLIPELPHDQPLELQEGQGFKVRQNTNVAGANYGWLCTMTLV